jgi:hypothetical protein
VAGVDASAGYGAAVTIVPRLVAFAVLAAVFCPAAAAIEPSRLALMPLPRQALGPDAVGLSLASDSGVDSNADAARHAGGGVTAADLARYGRITGYTLDYALPLTSARPPAHSLLGVQTIAELYRDESTATKGLVFWRGVTKRLSTTKVNGVTVGLSPFEVRVGDGTFAFVLTYRRAGKPILYVGDVVFRTGDLLGAVFVTASDEPGLRARTVGFANRLEMRIQQVLAGKIHGPPVAIPAKK